MPRYLANIVLFLVTIPFISTRVMAQEREVFNILYTLKNKLNLTIPVTDSLDPTFIKFKSIRKIDPKLNLSKTERKELKEKSKHQQGLKLNNNLIPGAKFISAELIFRALYNWEKDTLATKYLIDHRPFIMISNPVFLNNTNKSVISVMYVGHGGGASTYLLTKKNNTWQIEKEL